MAVDVACLLVPILLAPLVVLALRPCFAVFLHEGAELFADVDLKRELSVAIGRYLAVANVIVFVLFWSGTYGCELASGPMVVSTLLAVSGVLIALVVTVFIVRNRVGLMGSEGVLTGVIAFAGGNLPLIVLVPVVLFLRTLLN